MCTAPSFTEEFCAVYLFLLVIHATSKAKPWQVKINNDLLRRETISNLKFPEAA